MSCFVRLTSFIGIPNTSIIPFNLPLTIYYCILGLNPHIADMHPTTVNRWSVVVILVLKKRDSSSTIIVLPVVLVFSVV